MALETEAAAISKIKRQDDEDDDDAKLESSVEVPQFSRITSLEDDLPRETTTSTTEDTGLWPLSTSSTWTSGTGLWGIPDSTTEDTTLPSTSSTWTSGTGLWGIPDSTTETTLWPKVTSTEDWPINSSDLSTMGAPTAEESIITEESTITNGVVTKTDSGQTVTVPNDEVVTVTRHTIIVTDKPPPLPTGTTFDTSVIPGSSLSAGEPAQTTEDGGREDADDGGGGGSPGLPDAAAAGIGVGGFLIISGIFVLVGFGVKRRRQKNREHRDTARPSDYDRDQDLEEKHFPEHMTPHTTGTQGDDPFAPFGGRVDRLDEASGALQTPNHVFEMDATTVAPVELPAISPGATPRPRPSAAEGQNINHVDQFVPRDPRANLNSLGTEGGEPRYVNHWNEYRAMGSG